MGKKSTVLGRKLEKSLLLAIQEEIATDKSFKQICDENTRRFGKKASKKRRRCQLRRGQLIRQTFEDCDQEKYLDLLKKHNLPLKKMPRNGFAALGDGDVTELEDDMSEDDEEDKPKTPAKKRLKNSGAGAISVKSRASTSKPRKDKKQQKNKASSKDTDGEEKKKIGEWFFYVHGVEGYADAVLPVSTEEGDEHLNDPLEYVQLIPSVVFEQKDEVYDCECISIFLSAELNDIGQGLVELYQTLRPNVLLLVRPWLASSLRVDLHGKDSELDHRRKLAAVARNFKFRDAKTQKMDEFWCQSAWEKHMMTMSNVAKQQRAEGKRFQTFTKSCLLVFDERIEFDFTVNPEAVASETGKIKPSSEVITKAGQSITRLRFLLPTSNYRTIREKIADQEIDDTIDRLAAALNIVDDEEDDEFEDCSTKQQSCTRLKPSKQVKPTKERGFYPSKGISAATSASPAAPVVSHPPSSMTVNYCVPNFSVEGEKDSLKKINDPKQNKQSLAEDLESNRKKQRQEKLLARRRAAAEAAEQRKNKDSWWARQEGGGEDGSTMSGFSSFSKTNDGKEAENIEHRNKYYEDAEYEEYEEISVDDDDGSNNEDEEDDDDAGGSQQERMDSLPEHAGDLLYKRFGQGENSPSVWEQRQIDEPDGEMNFYGGDGGDGDDGADY